MPAWEATGVLAEPRRGTGRAQTPLIGREEEASLLDVAGRAGRARGTAPSRHRDRPGRASGKSRLLRELMSNLADSGDPPTIRRGQCPPYGAGIAYWALAEVLNDEFEIRDTDAPEAAWEKLRSGVTELMSELGDEAAGERNAALLAIPLGLEPPEELQHSESDPQRMREALFSAARAVVEAIARRRPLVLAIDDIHWADEGMLDLIDHLTRWVRAPLLLVCLTRDELLERRPGWGGGRRNATTISLEPLTETETRELVAALMPSCGRRQRRRRPAGRRALRRQPAVRRGDGQPPARGGDRGGAGPAQHGAVAARRPARLARSTGAAAAAVRLGGRADLLGGRARGDRRGGGPRPGQDPREPRGEGPARPEPRRAGWPASASTPSSTS